MNQLSRDSWLAIGLFLLLLLITIFAAARQTRENINPPLASFSSNPDGAKALWLWLDELGYSVSDEVFTTFQIPTDAGLILMLEPFGVSSTEWQTIDDWVEEGGNLIVAGDDFNAALAARRYDFNIAYLATPTATLALQTPLLTSPPVEPVEIKTQAYYRPARDDFVAHLAIESGPVLVSFDKGKGQVILSATAFPFSNVGLKEAGNPSLMLNIITTADPSDLVWFDEWHHGRRLDRTEIIGPGNWLRYTSAGRSLLFVATVIFVAALLRGRHFGRPVPLPQDTARRRPLEYITAIANLNRRAGHRLPILGEYHHRLKRGLGQRYRLNSTLSDDEYVARLTQLNPHIDQEALSNLLRRLQQRHVSESEMIKLAAETAVWLKES